MFTVRIRQNGEITDTTFENCADAWQEFGQAITHTGEDLKTFVDIIDSLAYTAWPVTTIEMAYQIDSPMPTYYAMATIA